jgi:hypothetical protein
LIDRRLRLERLTGGVFTDLGEHRFQAAQQRFEFLWLQNGRFDQQRRRKLRHESGIDFQNLSDWIIPMRDKSRQRKRLSLGLAFLCHTTPHDANPWPFGACSIKHYPNTAWPSRKS